MIINRHKHLSLRQQRELLPIFRVKREILYALEKHRTLVLIGGEIAFPILLLTWLMYSIDRDWLWEEHSAAPVPA